MGAPQGIARSSDAQSAGRCGIRVETLGKEPEMKVCLDQRLGDRALLTGRGGVRLFADVRTTHPLVTVAVTLGRR